MRETFKLKNTKAIRKQMEEYLSTIVEMTAQEAGNMIKQMLIDNLEDWYSTYTPEVYNRTYEVLNAIKVSSIEKSRYRYYVEIYFDLDEISDSHQIMKTEYREAFPQIIEDGWTTPWGFSREGSHAFENLQNDIDHDLKERIKDFLDRHGYDVNFR